MVLAWWPGWIQVEMRYWRLDIKLLDSVTSWSSRSWWVVCWWWILRGIQIWIDDIEDIEDILLRVRLGERISLISNLGATVRFGSDHEYTYYKVPVSLTDWPRVLNCKRSCMTNCDRFLRDQSSASEVGGVGKSNSTNSIVLKNGEMLSNIHIFDLPSLLPGGLDHPSGLLLHTRQVSE